MGLLKEHRGPLSADLHRFHRYTLDEVLTGTVAPLREVAAWVAHLPPDSATYRAQHPDGSWQLSEDLELQRRMLLTLDRVAFFTAKTAGYKIQDPEPYLFPWEEPEDDGTIKGDSMDTDEADDWLGWTEEMKKHLGN